jgi:hypothetical protein
MTNLTGLMSPGNDEAVVLFNSTSALPLLRWGMVPDELGDYLELIYRGGGDSPYEVGGERTGPAQPWAEDPLPDTDVTWVSFTGGKDSVAAALDVEAAGRRPVLWHLAGLNRGMGDEPRYAQRIADRMGWPLIFDRVSITGKKNGLMELPTKNQVNALFLTSRMWAESSGSALLAHHGHGRYASREFVTGWHASDTQDKQAFGYDYSDGVEAIAAFNAYLSARYPGLRYRQVLHDTTEAWARIADAGLLQFIKGCVCPLRYKARVRAANVKKFGWLLAGRCGSCVKCAWEEHALQSIGVLPPDGKRLAHGLPWMVRDFGERFPGVEGDALASAVREFLVPVEVSHHFRRQSFEWPPQDAPLDEWEGTPHQWVPRAARV